MYTTPEQAAGGPPLPSRPCPPVMLVLLSSAVALARQSHTQPMQPPIVLLGQLMQVLCAFKTTCVAYKLCWQSGLLITYPALEEQGPLMSP